MQPTSPWPDWLDHLWAKSPEQPGQSGESLPLHTWRALGRLRDLHGIRPRLAEQVGEQRLWHRLFWACVLHDLGKAAPGFQDRLRGRADTPVARQWGRHRHEIISLAFVAWAFPPADHRGAVDPIAWADQRWVVAAIASHHRDADEITSLYPDAPDAGLGEILATLPEATIRGIHRWLAECLPAWADQLALPGVEVPPPPALPDALRLIEADGADRVGRLLREYRHWVSQLEDQLEPRTPGILLRGLLLQADHTASAHTRPLRPLRITVGELRARWSLGTTYEHQERCAVTDGSALLTAPTGSGKTEAALLWAARQAESSGAIPRLFYTLPYQASMNAMYRRLVDAFSIRRVGLQHGRSLLALYRFAMEAEPDPALAARQARWRKKLAYLGYFPVRVFSPYQMLRALYRLKGYEAMLLDYQGAAFIFDEIHAYAPERLGLILALIEHLHREYNARFLVMSATLPAIARRRLGEAVGPHTVIEASSEVYRAFRRHRVDVLDGDLLDHLEMIAAWTRQGASVLVCCNTVQRAQDAWKALRELLEGMGVVLLHGRFNGRDRLAREELVREASGTRSERRRPVVLVATQVVEVSLDIDLDTIFSDPAPLEALIQRFGRVNRRRLQPEPAPVHVFCKPDDGQGIYDPDLVRAALRVLQRASGQAIDEADVNDWLDSIYASEIAAAWDEKYSKSLRDGRRILDGLRPFQSEDDLADRFDAAFDSVEVLPATLLPEYQRLHVDDPIRASSLLVPISEKRKRQLWWDGLIRTKTWPPVIDVPYSADLGLDFSALRGDGE
jgi:CRISPR-associated endonuclease/helicase Cas3